MRSRMLIPLLLLTACGAPAPEPCTPAAIETLAIGCELAIAERPQDEKAIGMACLAAIDAWTVRCGGRK